ncbi:NUDIX domain-containing protein [Rhodovulum bhavnagarense]|uniref:NUDIX domain-containing protein n=1 Tax=Rhodovulum bhavnagarense TaxID=992286 RepID=A0A4V2SWQ4_9RHOB|nr:NUDIX hydrolase [Rhodovulum bhavnagarense]TCP63096.1 NUDIX domain-containing protein [Rhodovulum bhavnagarense]
MPIAGCGPRADLVSVGCPRLAVRALILHENRLLLVNAMPTTISDLWCAPGGGVEPGQSLPDNLAREVHEETGLRIEIGAPCMVNEFHEPGRPFHQVDIYFHCRLTGGRLDKGWTDPAGVVTQRRFFTRQDMDTIRFKPDSLPRAAWDGGAGIYDPLEPLIR